MKIIATWALINVIISPDDNNFSYNSPFITYHHWANSKEGINLWTQLNEHERAKCYIYIQYILQLVSGKILPIM